MIKNLILFIFVIFLSSCHGNFSTVSRVGYFLPINIKEQLSGYIRNIEAGYIVLPIYASNTASKELILDSPFFISNFNNIEEKLNKTINKAKQFQVTFIFINREGEMIALPIPVYPFFNDYSIEVYKACISKKWQNEICSLFSNKKMEILSNSWMRFGFYYYYEHGNLHYVEPSKTESSCREFIDYISTLIIKEQENGIWKLFFTPVPYQKISNSFLDECNKKLLVIEQLNTFNKKGQLLYRINKSDIIPITQYVGKLSPEFLTKIKIYNPELMLFIPKDIFSTNAYDCLRHYANDNSVVFLFLDNSGDVIWCK